MIINGKPQSLGELQTFNTQCPWCKRWFELQGFQSCQPKRMTCGDCFDAYEAKVRKNFALDEGSRKLAQKIGSMAKGNERTEKLMLWRQLMESSDIRTVLRYEAMIALAENVIRGIEPSVPDQTKTQRGKW